MNTLKVSHKLALGFAAVLALTLAVALIGSYGMDALISRSDRAQSAARLLDEANRIRYAQVSFETRGDPLHVEAVEQSVARIVELVQQQKGNSAIHRICSACRRSPPTCSITASAFSIWRRSGSAR